ncbi:MAG: hypothetical protein ABIA74_00620 [bacterium]
MKNIFYKKTQILNSFQNLKFILFIFIFFLTTNLNSSSINAKISTSIINIQNNANLNLKNPINNFEGKIKTNTSGSINGKNINFNKGKLENSDNKIQLTGILTNQTTNKIILDGNKNINIKRGTTLQSIEISNDNNKIDGYVLTENDITLLDENTTVSLSIHDSLICNIQLNFGTVYLQDDLYFTNNKKIIGPGKIIPQSRKIIFNGTNLNCNTSICFGTNSNIKLNTNIDLSETWTFDDASTHIIEGQGNILSLENLGLILINENSTLIIRNLTINNISEQNIKCLNDTAKIIFQNVKLVLSDDFQFQTGSFEVLDSCEFNGPYKFAYQTTKTSTIKSKSNLILDNFITFSYDPGIPIQNLINLQDETSSIIFNNATLHVTTTGIQLTKGNLFINGQANFIAEKQTFTKDIPFNSPTFSRADLNNEIIIEGGIDIGNNNEDDDLYCEISNMAFLNINQGTLNYKNINWDSWFMQSDKSCLNIDTNGTLYLHQDLNLNNGYAQFNLNSTLARKVNKNLSGEINSTGKIKKLTLL